MDVRSGRRLPSTTALVHRGSAIRLLQGSINDRQWAISDKVLATICPVSCSHVCCTPNYQVTAEETDKDASKFDIDFQEVIFGDHPGHQKHVDGMNQIVVLRGGIESLCTVPVIYWLVMTIA
jgi:hypothetical protein